MRKDDAIRLRHMLDAAQEAIEFAHASIKRIGQGINGLQEKCGKPKADHALVAAPDELMAAIEELVGSEIVPAITIPEKAARSEAMKALWERS